MMQYDEKTRLLQKIQIQALAAELEKTEAEDLVEELFKEVGIGYHVRVCGQMSWNNSVSDWPASSLQHCTCTTSNTR